MNNKEIIFLCAAATILVLIVIYQFYNSQEKLTQAELEKQQLETEKQQVENSIKTLQSEIDGWKEQKRQLEIKKQNLIQEYDNMDCQNI